ncbi:hypothetical protein GCM10022198_25300 [Klugiella xanthotipulae]|uniref:Uncharacterized protein DUF4177 n=1 Tax=Klugiella xanthotipulae TaxID=244735 RepID=A0A543HZ35_9MICO|nr:DUF4177 domain-containing protein [Klugiella xanthotipulae]TQM63579.1 uncharacterized protein DUF4177 [Klugiella xanthotipulae]
MSENLGAHPPLPPHWEYFVTPLLLHSEAQILNNWGSEGWELVQVVAGPAGGNVGYFKRQAVSV